MKNTFFNKFNSIIKIKIEGRNINNFIKRIIKNNINIIKYIPISYKEAILIISYEDYLKIKKIKTIYEITVISKYGRLKIKEKLKQNKYLLFFLIMGIILLYILSNIIFNIEVIHSSSEVKNLVYKELKENGIKKYIFKKSYEEIEKIEEKILEDNKDKIEWIEITETGTSYIIRVEERKIKEDNDDNVSYDIVSSKNAIIYSIEATSGEKVKKTNDYVTKGDVIISGSINKPDGNKIIYNSKF